VAVLSAASLGSVPGTQRPAYSAGFYSTETHIACGFRLR
jgi:hypothetical protein